MNTSAIKKTGSKKAFHFSIIPKDDPKQALRLRRFFISLFIYIFNLPLSYLAYQAGIMELQALYGSLFILLVINHYFIYCLSHRSEQADEGSQPYFCSDCVASLVVMYAIFFVYEARGILFSVYILILSVWHFSSLIPGSFYLSALLSW